MEINAKKSVTKQYSSQFTVFPSHTIQTEGFLRKTVINISSQTLLFKSKKSHEMETIHQVLFLHATWISVP
jgi:hypothetical protein